MRRNDSWAPAAAAGLVGLIAFTVWTFATTFGLDLRTGAAVFGRLTALAVAVCVCWKFGDDFDLLHLSVAWPVLLGLFWACWWPALDFWAASEYPAFLQREDLGTWWSAWYTKFGGLVILIAGGYGIKKLMQPSY